MGKPLSELSVVVERADDGLERVYIYAMEDLSREHLLLGNYGGLLGVKCLRFGHRWLGGGHVLGQEGLTGGQGLSGDSGVV